MADKRGSAWIPAFAGMTLIIFIAVELAGCATVQKKFTRKKKEPAHRPSVVYIEQGAFQKKYSNAYYYKTHFVLWKTWQDELLDTWGGNHKKVVRAAQEAWGHLSELKQYLEPEKQRALQIHLDSLEAIMQKIEGGHYSKSEEGALRVELERIYRVVAAHFYYEKVKDQILPEKVDLLHA